jgi:multimeric flavodoxin WrbA
LRALASEICEEQSSEEDINSTEVVNISDSTTILPNVSCDKCSDLAERVEVLEERMNTNLSELSKSLNSLKAKEELKTELSRE